MKVVGLLVWHDESASWLASCVAGFARVCDTIIALDGAYSLYPGARPRSHPDQSEAIIAAAEAMGVGCLVYRPKDVYWGNEVEKRNLSLKLAAPFLEPMEDWVLVFDGDYQVMLCEDPAFTRAILAETDKNVMTYTLLDNADILKDEDMAKVATGIALSTDWTLRDRGIFRWTEDLRYGPAHYCVRGTYDGELLWLRGPDLSAGQQLKAAEAEHLGRNLVAIHRRQSRAKVRNDASIAYAELRAAHKIEEITEPALFG